MVLSKYILLALVAAGATVAQSGGGSGGGGGGGGDNCPQTGDDGVYNIQNQGDAAALQGCQDFKGSVTIQPQAAGNLELNGVKTISGNLTCVNATGLTSISSDQLATIGGDFVLRNLTLLSNLQMNSLSQVDIINFESCPGLQSLNFNQGVQKASGVRIVNTKLGNMNGIELGEVAALEITNNPELNEFNVNNLKSVSSYVTVAANAATLKISFPNLEMAANLTFRNISSLDLPSLSGVNGSFGCYSNSFESFSGANLTKVGNALVFDDNSQLTNISLPMLQEVGGGYQIANNTNLKVIDGFKALKSIGGALDFSGVFTNVTLPSLQTVSGTFNMQSTGTLDCAPFQNEKGKVVHGGFECQGGLSKASSSNGGSSTSGGSGSGSKSAANVAVDLNMGALGLVGAVAAAFIV